MTLPEAIETIKRVGLLEAAAGSIRYEIRWRGPEITEALQTLKARKPEALAILSGQPQAVPHVNTWPESLRELAKERAKVSSDPETAKREVWLSWAEWKAQGLNRLFAKHGVMGKPGGITADIIKHGEKPAKSIEPAKG